MKCTIELKPATAAKVVAEKGGGGGGSCGGQIRSRTEENLIHSTLVDRNAEKGPPRERGKR